MKCYKFFAIVMLAHVVAVPVNANPFFSDEFLIGAYNKHSRIQVHVGGVRQKHKVLKQLKVTLQKGAPQYGGYRGLSDVMHALARQAEAAGADAIKQFKYVDKPFNLIGWGSISATGVAIRYYDRPPARKKARAKPKIRKQPSGSDFNKN